MTIAWLAVNASHAHASLAAPQLEAACRGRADATWQVFNVTAQETAAECALRLAECAPDVCAATLYLFTAPHALAILDRFHALCPDCPIIVGGPELLGDNEALLRRHPALTLALRGEGETAFPAWLAVKDQPARWPTIPGLCFLTPEGRYHDGGTATPVADFDALPAPAASPLFAWDRPFVHYETTRGCGNHCAFCVSSLTPRLRHRSLRTVADDLRRLRDGGARELRLLDRTFNAHPARAIALLRTFAAFPELRFHLELHPAWLPPSLRQCLAELPAGQFHFDVGLQSTDPAVLAACRRRGDPARTWDGLAYLAALPNLALHVDLIAGLPEQTPASLHADIVKLVRLGVPEIQLETLKLLPGTPLRAEAADRGLRYAPGPPYEVLATPHFGARELLATRADAALLDRYHNHPVCHQAVRQAAPDRDAWHALRNALAAAHALAHGLALERRVAHLAACLALRHPAAWLTLAHAWLREGHTGDLPAFPVSRWSGPLPPGGTWLLGDAQLATRATRVRLLTAAGQRWWYHYDARQAAPASALYHLP
jgi:hypothetical protein